MILDENGQVNKRIITYLHQLHLAPDNQRVEAEEKWQEELSLYETMTMMENMPRNKAISYDMWTDDMFQIRRGKTGEIDAESI